MAINRMNGQFLGNRAIRVNWASQRTDDKQTPSSTSSTPSSSSAPPSSPAQTYEAILSQAPSFNTTVYIGNVTPDTNRS